MSINPQDTRSTKNNVVIHETTLNEFRSEFEDVQEEKLGQYINEFIGASEDARESDSRDKQMSLIQGIKTYPKAVMWSVILSSCLVMEGYDTKLMASFFGFHPFTKKYGILANPETDLYKLTAPWQVGLGMCVMCGEIIGLHLAGWVADRLGYRKTLLIALFLIVCFIFVLFFAENIQTLAVGEVLCGIPWGFFQTLTVTYASEVCPTVLRFYLTTYVNLCWVFGQLISAGVIKGLSNNTTQWAYRIPFAIQWVYPIPLAIGVYLAPEGPYWLVKKNKINEAKKSITRLITKNDNIDPEQVAELMVTKMKITLEKEKAIDVHSNYRSCFSGSNARRTRIAILTWVAQAWTGSGLSGNAAYFYQKAGMSASYSFTFVIIQFSLGIIGTLSSWVISNKLGRFQIYFTGVSIQVFLILLIGILGCIDNPNIPWGVGSLMLLFVFFYDIGVGPVTYCLVGEIPNSRLRTKTVVLARNMYNIAGIVSSILSPYMLNSTKWNWGAKTGFFWAGVGSIFLVWIWFDMPETKDRTFAELDALFEMKVKARDFKKTEVDPFEAAELVRKLNKSQLKSIIERSDSLVSVSEQS